MPDLPILALGLGTLLATPISMHRWCRNAVAKACQQAGRQQLPQFLPYGRKVSMSQCQTQINGVSSHTKNPCESAASLAANCKAGAQSSLAFHTLKAQQPVVSGVLRHAGHLCKQQHTSAAANALRHSQQMLCKGVLSGQPFAQSTFRQTAGRQFMTRASQVQPSCWLASEFSSKLQKLSELPIADTMHRCMYLVPAIMAKSPVGQALFLL